MTVHGPPVSANPHPFVTVRVKASEAIPLPTITLAVREATAPTPSVTESVAE